MLKFNLQQKFSLRFSLGWLVLITFLAFSVRFILSDSLPAALNRDEAAIGYNALLLSQTGLDEWGRSWPLALESFGDYKLPGYVWAVVGAGRIFGWHDWVVRLPSVLAGTLLPLAGYFWLKQAGSGLKTSLALATLLAIAPFSWFYSRMAFEANLALTIWVFWLGLLALKKNWLNLNQKTWPNLILDMSLWSLAGLAILTYNTPLLILPFILIGLPVYFGWRSWRSWGLAWLGLLIITSGGFYGLAQLFGQKSGITIFSDPTIWADFIRQFATGSGISTLWLNHWWGFLGSQMLERWWASITPNFLVTHGGAHPWHNLPGSGHLYWLTYLLAVLGLATASLRSWRLIGQKFWLWSQSTQAWWLYLTLISLIPAIITVDAPHATRSLLFFVLLHVWAVQGLSWLWRKIVKFQPNLARFFVFGIITILAIEVNFYSHQYFSLYPNRQEIFKPGLPKMLDQINQLSIYVPVAVVGDGYEYVSWAWYLKMPASEFFSTVVKQQPDRIGFRYGQQIGRYHFIAAARDIQPTEKFLVQWQDKAWQLQTF